MRSIRPRLQSRRTLIGIAIAAATFTGCGSGGEVPVAGDTPSVPVIEASTSVATPAPPTTAIAPATPSTEPPAPPIAPTTAAPEAAPAQDDAGDDAPPEAAPTAFRGVSLVDELVVFDAPDGVELTSLSATTAFGTPTVVSVLDETTDWVHIVVPVRPNDLTGWVRAADVRLEPVDAEIHIDLATRTLKLTEHGEPAGSWPVAIGRSDRPTPTGRFFITDKLATGDANSVWGAHAFGLSAYSDVLTDFIGGIGQIGVHGTNNPDSIGQAASSGCVRLPNEVIDALIDRLPLGTPVHIT